MPHMDIYGDVTDTAVAGLGVIGVIYVLYILLVGFFGLGSYILQSIALYNIASRRGIKHAWLSWIPVGSIWILGCISDQYQYVVKRQVKNKRKVMLVLNIAMAAMALLMVVICIGVFGGVIALGFNDHAVDLLAGNLIGSMFGLGICSLALSGLSIALVVIQYICLYDLYTSCDPSNNITYLLLSIFLGFLLPIFLFICRNKDLGMPPKKKADPQIPVEPWENSNFEE